MTVSVYIWFKETKLFQDKKCKYFFSLKNSLFCKLFFIGKKSVKHHWSFINFEEKSGIFLSPYFFVQDYFNLTKLRVNPYPTIINFQCYPRKPSLLEPCCPGLPSSGPWWWGLARTEALTPLATSIRRFRPIWRVKSESHWHTWSLSTKMAAIPTLGPSSVLRRWERLKRLKN